MPSDAPPPRRSDTLERLDRLEQRLSRLEALQADTLEELKEHREVHHETRDALQEVARGSWLAYAQEIGRVPLPGSLRVDVVLVLGAAGAMGLLGSTTELGALVGPVTALLGLGGP